MKKNYKGFTLVELLVVLVIVAITMSAAAPAFQGMVARNRIATQTNDFLLALNLARSEALRIGDIATVQAQDASNSGDEFGQGWCVVVGDPGNCAGTLVRSFPALQAESTLDSIENVDSITFNSLGGLTTAERNVDLCYAGQEGRRIRVSLVGRSSSHKPDPDDASAIQPDC